VSEKLVMWMAWRLPRKVAYWAAIRVMANATQGRWSHQLVPDLLAMDALARWEEQ